jgi:signal-transduction protein with cAMP-binding, CBS, and nucleotidyltransferase domain
MSRFFLRQIPLFSQLKDNKLAHIEKGNEEPFENGDKIVTEGRKAKYFLLLLYGKAK